jgi:dCMP deaminase
MALRSLCVKAQVGAVIADRYQRIAATGYNGPAAGLEFNTPCSQWCPRAEQGAARTSSYDNCLANHAEANAFLDADASRIKGGTIYVSRAVCLHCIKLISNSGLSRLVHRVTADDLHRNPDLVEDMALNAGLETKRITVDGFC